MPKESNYFEEAYRLCQDADPLVSLTCKSLYDTMLHNRQNNNILPIGNFNILYFFQSTIRALSKRFPGIVLASSAFPYHTEPIRAFNRPDESQAQKFAIQGDLSIIESYIEIVYQDSSQIGCDFDVNYSCFIIFNSLNNNNGVMQAWNGSPPNFLKEKSTMDFDFWLAGFDSGKGTSGKGT